ncbi:MAG: TetR family transcriptional regulator, partial [Actinomycetota bacterium]|nr:TetR family transcriptional regulator [Actinomycetota bacterium]
MAAGTQEGLVQTVRAAGSTESGTLGERLLNAAAEVFAEQGYERAGVAEIARRA